MDYKYIEQLLERFWQCETSLEEERILRTFFQQKEIPANLRPYKDLFVYERMAGKVKMDKHFDAKILAQTENPVVKARRLRFGIHPMPLFKAAAAVALIASLGTAMQRYFESRESDYNYDVYEDTYTDPQTAYGEISNALMSLSESINKCQEQYACDSVQASIKIAGENNETVPDSSMTRP